MLSLRELSTSDPIEPLVFEDVWDRNADCDKRKLPMNEKLAIALNEVAARSGKGHFMFLPSRDSYKKNGDPARLPEWRTATSPGMDYCELLYMRFEWSHDGRTAFGNTSQRERYLNASFLINPPAASTPLYAVQVVPYPRAPAYTCLADRPTLTLYTVPSETAFYLAETKDVERSVGLWHQDRSDNGRKRDPPSGADPDHRLANAQVFEPTGKHRKAMAPHRVTSPMEIYNKLVELCRPGRRIPSFNTQQLQQMLAQLKKADSDTHGVQPTTHNATGHQPSAFPPSRRGEKRAKRGARQEG